MHTVVDSGGDGVHPLWRVRGQLTHRAVRSVSEVGGQRRLVGLFQPLQRAWAHWREGISTFLKKAGVFLVSTSMRPCHQSTQINPRSAFSPLPSVWKSVCHISASLVSCPLVSVGYEVNFFLVNRGSGGHTLGPTWLDGCTLVWKSISCV